MADALHASKRWRISNRKRMLYRNRGRMLYTSNRGRLLYTSNRGADALHAHFSYNPALVGGIRYVAAAR